MYFSIGNFHYRSEIHDFHSDGHPSTARPNWLHGVRTEENPGKHIPRNDGTYNWTWMGNTHFTNALSVKYEAGYWGHGVNSLYTHTYKKILHTPR